MITLNFRSEATGDAYRQLLQWALTYCAELRFLTFDCWPLSDRSIDLLERLRPHLLAEELVTNWPGTQLGPGWTARLRRYQFTPEVVDILLSITTGLPDWGGDLPEDLHLVRPDGGVFLGSGSSEEDAWLELTDEEGKDVRGIAELTSLLYEERPK